MNRLLEENISCQLSPMRENSMCMIFNSVENKDFFIGKADAIAGECQIGFPYLLNLLI